MNSVTTFPANSLIHASVLLRWAAVPERPTITICPLDGPRWVFDSNENTIALSWTLSPAEASTALGEALDEIAAFDKQHDVYPEITVPAQRLP